MASACLHSDSSLGRLIRQTDNQCIQLLRLLDKDLPARIFHLSNHKGMCYRAIECQHHFVSLGIYNP